MTDAAPVGPQTILFLHPSAELYGADQALLALATGLDPARWRASVALPREGPLAERLRAAGVAVEIGPLGIGARSTLVGSGLLQFAAQLPRSILWTRALVRRQRPALVHVNTLIVLGGALGARLAGARLVWQVHEILPRPRWLARSFALLLRLLAARVIFVSRACAEALTCFDRGLAARSEVIWNGLSPLQAHAPGRTRDEVRTELGIEPHETLVLLPGRINSWKGQGLLIEAARRLRELQPELRYLLAGDAPPGQPVFERELEETVARTGTGDVVQRVSFREAVGELFAAADVVAIPSTRPEPFGLVALEAMRFEKPVVAADHGGLTEIVESGVTGLRFAPGDPGALADALAELARDEPRARAMGLRGHARQRERFTIEAHLAAFDRAYSEIARRSPADGPRIVHVALGKADKDRMNGVNQVVHHLAQAQARAGLRVEVWGVTPTPFAPTFEREYGLRLFARTRTRFVTTRALGEALRAAPADCVFHLHGAFLPEMWAVARALVAGGQRMVFTPHGSYHRVALRKRRGAKVLYARAFDRAIVRAAHALHVFTAQEAAATARLFRSGGVRVVPNGCELGPALARDREPGTRLTIGYLGRLDMHTKGLDLLFAAVARRLHAGARIELHIAGDGPDRARLTALAASLGVEPWTVFHGPLFGADKRHFLAQLDVFALCSRHEGMPVAALEALAAGCPLIVTPGTGLVDAVRSAGAGAVVEPPDAPGIAAALGALEAQAEDLGPLRTAARRLASASSWDRIANRIGQELYGFGGSVPTAETKSSAAPRPPLSRPRSRPAMHPRPSASPNNPAQALRRRLAEMDVTQAQARPPRGRTWFSRVVRLLLPRQVPPVVYDESGKTFLHIGAGRRPIETWINAALSTPGARTGRDWKPDWKVDPTRPVLAPDGHFDGVLLSHVNERMSYVQSFDLMAEILRTLRPGSALRVEASTHGGPSGCSTWTPALLRELLETLGFADVAEVTALNSQLPGIEPEVGEWSFFVECTKPIAKQDRSRRLAS